MKSACLMVTISAILLSASGLQANGVGDVTAPTQLATTTTAISAVSPALNAKSVALQPTLQWSSSIAGATSFLIDLSTSPTFSGTSATTVGTVSATTTSFTIPADKKLSPGTTYYWRIGVFTAASHGHLAFISEAFSFTTIPQLTVTVVGGGHVSTTPGGLSCGGGSTCHALFAADSSVTVKATTSASRTATVTCGTGTGASGKGSAQKTVVLSGNKACTVRFTLDSSD